MTKNRLNDDLSKAVEIVSHHPEMKKALSYVKETLQETVAIQKELVLIEAPSYHEQNRAKRYAQLLEQAGLSEVKIDNSYNVYGYIRGSGNTGKSILLEGHLDTVFDFGSATEIKTDEDGKIHCPGICDDTRALAANWAVVKAICTHHLKPYHDIIIAGTVCEEGLGGMKGMSQLIKELSQETELLASLSIDGPTGSHFYANATGMVDWEVEFEGPGGHAWTAHDTASAVQAACRAAALISEIELPIEPKTTCTVSLIEGGQAVHGIAQRAKFSINARSNSQIVLNQLNEKMIRAIHDGLERENQRFKPDRQVAVRYKKTLDIPAGEQAEDCRMIQLAKLVTKAFGIEPIFKKGGCTNANIPIFHQIPAVTFGRGGEEFGTHTLEEWFNPKGVYVCEQKSLLMLFVLAGLNQCMQEPLGETLK